MKNNSIVKKKINNPSNRFEVYYSVDGKHNKYEYRFDRTKMFSLPTLFGRTNICFYEHGTIEPLDPEFVANENTLSDINLILNEGLTSKLTESAKNRSAEMPMKIILGLGAIIGLVLIVVLG